MHHDMKTISIDEPTFRRLISTMNDMVHAEKRNLSYDDVINQLIDVYQERLALSGENAGG
jgi:predicted CopG family antitoxin